MEGSQVYMTKLFFYIIIALTVICDNGRLKKDLESWAIEKFYYELYLRVQISNIIVICLLFSIESVLILYCSHIAFPKLTLLLSNSSSQIRH